MHFCENESECCVCAQSQLCVLESPESLEMAVIVVFTSNSCTCRQCFVAEALTQCLYVYCAVQFMCVCAHVCVGVCVCV